MSQFTYVHIVNVGKRQQFSKSFTRISDAIDYVKSYPRSKGCFIYAVRYDEVIAIKSDLAPMKIFHRDSDYVLNHIFLIMRTIIVYFTNGQVPLVCHVTDKQVGSVIQTFIDSYNNISLLNVSDYDEEIPFEHSVFDASLLVRS